jgi:hypothetical protein
MLKMQRFQRKFKGKTLGTIVQTPPYFFDGEKMVLRTYFIFNLDYDYLKVHPYISVVFLKLMIRWLFSCFKKAKKYDFSFKKVYAFKEIRNNLHGSM